MTVRRGNIGSYDADGVITLDTDYQAVALSAMDYKAREQYTEIPPYCTIRKLVIHLETVHAGASTLDFILMGGDGSDTHLKYCHEVTALTIEKDTTDTTIGVVVYDFGENGFQYTELEYCDMLASILAKVDSDTADIVSVSLEFEV
jgi:hypothetical protein